MQNLTNHCSSIACSSHDLVSKLGVGTVQFGLDYGVSNQVGQTSLSETLATIELLWDAGVTLFDTAPAYGEAEVRLGEAKALNPDKATAMRVVTKCPSVSGLQRSASASGMSVARYLAHSFEQSCHRLEQNKLYGLLVHSVQEIYKPGAAQLWEALQGLKEMGLVKKIGVSVYDPANIDQLLRLGVPDIVQLPFNVMDQRFLTNGYLTDLKSLNIEIHSRSVFLQGLLLMPLDRVPPYFNEYKHLLEEWQEAIRSDGITALDGALMFTLQQPMIDYVICGACDRAQWQELIRASQRVDRKITWHENADTELGLINPTQWVV